MISEKLKKAMRDKYIANGCWGTETFGKALGRLADTYGDKTALKDGDLTISYREWDTLVNKCANLFEEKGLSKGDKAVIQLPNSVTLFIVSFAMFRMGVVPVFALPAHREREISTFIHQTRAKLYILPKTHLGFSYGKMGKNCISDTDCQLLFEDEIRESLNGECNTTEYPENNVSAYDTAVLLVSGGTTAIPKLIPRSHADYLYDAKTFADVVGMNRTTIFLAAIPAAHNFTFANPGVVGTALSGGCTVLSRNGGADEILDLIMEEKVTVTSMVPSLLNVCAEMAQWEEEEDLESLSTILVGGAVLLPDVLKAAETNLHCKVRQVFGTAEGLNTITPVDMPAEQVAGCQGVPISEYDEILIVDEEGKEVGRNEYGEMIIRGPYTIMNYYENEEADKEAFRADGFYRTGDKAFMDEDGCIHVCGRIREQINKSGEKIIPAELESVIKEYEGICDVSVIGIPDANTGYKICACVVPEGQEPDVLELREFMLDKGVAVYKLPDHVMNLPKIPLTAVGKPDKNELLKMFQERQKMAYV